MLVAIMKCFLKYKKILIQLLYHEGHLIIVLFRFLTGRDIDTPEARLPLHLRLPMEGSSVLVFLCLPLLCLLDCCFS